MTASSRHTVLFAGVRSSTVAQVAAHVPEIDAIVCEQGQEVLARLAEQPCSLVVLEHHLQNPAALGVLSWLRLGLGLSTLPVVYCLPARSRSEMPVRLSGPLQVSRTLFHPYSTGKLARTVVELLGLPAREAETATPVPSGSRSLDGVMSRLWDKSRPRAMESVEFLHTAIAALRSGSLSTEQRLEAERELHKLTGLVETYGYMEAGATARAMSSRLGPRLKTADADFLDQQLRLLRVQLEELRKSPREGPLGVTGANEGPPEAARGNALAAPTEDEPDAEGEDVEAASVTSILQLAAGDDHVTRLRGAPPPVVAEPAVAPEPTPVVAPPLPVESPRLLLVDLDAELGESLRTVAGVRNIRLDQVSHPDQAMSLLAQKSYASILVDMSLRDHYDAANRLLASCHAFTPPLPALVVSAAVDFTDRVQIAQLGVRGFLQKPVSAGAVLDAFEMAVFKQSGRTSSVVMAMHGDRAELDSIRSILQPEGLTVVGESQPDRFWDTLEACVPDAILLDVDMPGIDGLAICQTLRNDLRWRLIPIVFLTSQHSTEFIRRIFTAGADDYVPKPFDAEELAVRVSLRVRRYRDVQKSVADGLTGLASHQESAAWLERHVNKAVAQKQRFALAVVRIHRLIEINDKWGRTVGDAVIARFGRFLSDSVMVTDLVSRWAGPEFIVGMPGLTRLEAADRMQDVVDSLRREQFVLPGGTLSVTCSVGVSALPSDGDSVDRILQAAEKACRTGLRQEGMGSTVVAAGQPAGPSASALDIAIIDADDELFGMLSSRSYHMRHFRQADEALSVVGGRAPQMKPRVILIGNTTPPLDGVTLVRHLAGDGVLKQARVILLVPSEASPELDSVRDLGRIEGMVQPYDRAAVMRKVRRALSEQLTGKLKME